MKLRSCMSLPAAPTINWSAFTFEAPAWLTNCLGFTPGAARQDFVFDGYETDEFDHLLSTDPSSRSFLSRLPFKRGSNRQLRRAATQDSSTDESLRSLLIDDRDAESFGDDSINMLLTTNAAAAAASGLAVDGADAELPLGHRSIDVPDDAELAREEELLRLAEEEEVERKRQRARRLAAERGLSRTATHASLHSQKSSTQSTGSKTRSSRSTSLKSQMSMIAIPQNDAGQEDTSPGILPHMRPS